MRSSVALSLLLLCIFVGATVRHPQQDSTKNSTEEEIRAARCDSYEGDSAAAQKRIEAVLRSDPANIFAQRLLPGVMAEQIKFNDRSAENMLLIRGTIGAYESAMRNLRPSFEEKRQISNLLLTLYGMISEEEQHAELLKLLSNSNLRSNDRSQLYAFLASQFSICANNIISNQEKIAKVEIEKAKACVTKGLDYAKQATALDESSNDAWQSKSDLLEEASFLAGIDSNPTQKTIYLRQANEARKRAEETSAKKASESVDGPQTRQTVGNIQSTEELTSFRGQNQLDQMVKGINIYSQLTLGSPTAADLEQRREAQQELEKSAEERLHEKPNWKTFSKPDEEIVAEMPDNMGKFAPVPGMYFASSEGVTYLISSQPRPAPYRGSSPDDKELNSVAWASVDSEMPFLNAADGNARFEFKLERKQIASGFPSRVYSLSEVSCNEKTESTIILYVSKTRYYQVAVQGARESDPRAQRFLKSIRFK
jgi:hypothetical protein